MSLNIVVPSAPNSMNAGVGVNMKTEQTNSVLSSSNKSPNSSISTHGPSNSTSTSSSVGSAFSTPPANSVPFAPFNVPISSSHLHATPSSSATSSSSSSYVASSSSSISSSPSISQRGSAGNSLPIPSSAIAPVSPPSPAPSSSSSVGTDVTIVKDVTTAKVKKRLARKAELARASRRRKKVYVTHLEEKVLQLTQQVQELIRANQLGLKYIPPQPLKSVKKPTSDDESDSGGEHDSDHSGERKSAFVSPVTAVVAGVPVHPISTSNKAASRSRSNSPRRLSNIIHTQEPIPVAAAVVFPSSVSSSTSRPLVATAAVVSPEGTTSAVAHAEAADLLSLVSASVAEHEKRNGHSPDVVGLNRRLHHHSGSNTPTPPQSTALATRKLGLETVIEEAAVGAAVAPLAAVPVLVASPRAVTTPSASNRSIKASYKNDIRRFAIPACQFTYINLVGQLRSIYQNLGPAFSIRYTDAEGDSIRITCDSELIEAYKLQVKDSPQSEQNNGTAAAVQNSPSDNNSPLALLSSVSVATTACSSLRLSIEDDVVAAPMNGTKPRPCSVASSIANDSHTSSTSLDRKRSTHRHSHHSSSRRNKRKSRSISHSRSRSRSRSLSLPMLGSEMEQSASEDENAEPKSSRKKRNEEDKKERISSSSKSKKASKSKSSTSKRARPRATSSISSTSAISDDSSDDHALYTAHSPSSSSSSASLGTAVNSGRTSPARASSLQQAQHHHQSLSLPVPLPSIPVPPTGCIAIVAESYHHPSSSAPLDAGRCLLFVPPSLTFSQLRLQYAQASGLGSAVYEYMMLVAASGAIAFETQVIGSLMQHGDLVQFIHKQLLQQHPSQPQQHSVNVLPSLTCVPQLTQQQPPTSQLASPQRPTSNASASPSLDGLATAITAMTTLSTGNGRSSK